MGAAIELLNFWGGRFVQFAWPMLVQSSVVMVVVLGLNWALERRVRAVVRYALLLLVLVKLVLPPSLAVPTGVGYWVGPAIKPVETAVIAPQIGWSAKEAPSPSLAKVAPLQPNVGHSVASTKDPVPAGSTETGKANPTSVAPFIILSWQAMCLIAWCVGVVGLAAYVLCRSWQVFWLTAQAEDAA